MNIELTRDAVLRVGEVYEVEGRRIVIKVDRNKNLTDMFLDGDVIRNISVNSFIEIRKGFLAIIGKVDGERIQEQLFRYEGKAFEKTNRNERFLTVSLIGFIERNGDFIGGTKELPLIGNEAYILTKERTLQIHSLVADDDLSVSIGSADDAEVPIRLPVDGLFNSHIAVFGNTGSGKSNTLALLYQELCSVLRERNQSEFSSKTRFLLFDFNGEYISPECILRDKTVYNLSTRRSDGDKLPVSESQLLDLEMLAILCNATDKTQKPFLRRTIDFYRHVHSKEDPIEYFRNILRKEVKHGLQMSDKVRVGVILDYLRSLLPPLMENDIEIDLVDDLEWVHKDARGFRFKGTQDYLCDSADRVDRTKAFGHISQFQFDDNVLSKIIAFLYLQLIKDVLSNRAQNEHIAPAIGKLQSKQKDIDKLFDVESNEDFWQSNFVVVNLVDVNLDTKKTIPLLLSKHVYLSHKAADDSALLVLIIDEAHNILSTESFRESESWKDYRLETFEEIIKEGRKFGVFVTFASQRPNDISPTIVSQAHNYFIHRLVNQKDLSTISNAVSYIDRISEESIPTLPTGTCIFSGVAGQRPLKIKVRELPEANKPDSKTLKFCDVVSAASSNSELAGANG